MPSKRKVFPIYLTQRKYERINRVRSEHNISCTTATIKPPEPTMPVFGDSKRCGNLNLGIQVPHLSPAENVHLRKLSTKHQASWEVDQAHDWRGLVTPAPSTPRWRWLGPTLSFARHGQPLPCPQKQWKPGFRPRRGWSRGGRLPDQWGGADTGPHTQPVRWAAAMGASPMGERLHQSAMLTHLSSPPYSSSQPLCQRGLPGQPSQAAQQPQQRWAQLRHFHIIQHQLPRPQQHRRLVLQARGCRVSWKGGFGGLRLAEEWRSFGKYSLLVMRTSCGDASHSVEV